MVLDVVLVAVSLGLILLASVVFTNAVEVLGQRLGMHQGATGSILAAVGTALPETVIPIIAIVWFRDASAKDIAVGAIAGAPFMLGTLALFVTGAAVIGFSRLGWRPRVMNADLRIVTRDLTFFLALYGVAVLTTFAHEMMPVRIVIALALVATYFVYVHVTVRSEAAGLEDVETLYLARLLHVPESMHWVIVQFVASLGLMIFSAHLFVGSVEALSSAAGISALVLSLIITPIATELPEKCNSVVWVRRKKDSLALANITGAMVFQSCFPVAFGIVGTRWDLLENHGVTMFSAVVTLVSASIFLAAAKTRNSLSPWLLLSGGGFYVLFLVYLFTR
jgi:cation:H+ antiporter